MECLGKIAERICLPGYNARAEPPAAPIMELLPWPNVRIWQENPVIRPHFPALETKQGDTHFLFVAFLPPERDFPRSIPLEREFDWPWRASRRGLFLLS
jgi:hypothetical protein